MASTLSSSGELPWYTREWAACRSRTLRSPSSSAPARGGASPNVKVTSLTGAFDNTLAPYPGKEELAMRQFTEDTLTDAVLARLKDASHPRFKQIIASAVKHLHGFARDVQLTEEEWFEGIKFLTAVGQKCDGKRQEFILLSDILGLSMMVVALNHKTAPGATEATVLGPFFAHGAPEFEYGADFTKGATVEGETTFFICRVRSTDGNTSRGCRRAGWNA